MPIPPVAADRRDERVAASVPSGVYACRYIATDIPAAATGNEWNLVAAIDNRGSGENCAAYFQARASGPGPTWASVSEVANFGGSGAMVGQEVDVWARGETAGIGVHVVVGDAGAVHEGTPVGASVGYGVLISNNGDPSSTWRRGLTVKDWTVAGVQITGNGGERCLQLSGTAVVGIDFSKLEAQSIVRVREGQRLAFEGTDSVTLSYETGRIRFQMLGRSMFEIDINTGDVFARGEFKRLA